MLKQHCIYSSLLIVILITNGCGQNNQNRTVTSIEVSPSSFTLPHGSTQQLTVTVTYGDGSTEDVTSSLTNVTYQPSITEVTAWDMVSVSSTGLVTPVPLATGSDTISVYYAYGDGPPYSYVSTNVSVTVGYGVPPELTGQWQSVHNGEKKWLGEVTDIIYTQIDTNQLQVIGSDNNTYYLIRAGIPDVEVSGRLNALVNASASYEQGGIRKAQTRNLAVGNISVILQNVHSGEDTEVTPNEDGSFDATLPSADYKLTATDTVTGEIVESTVEVKGTRIDLGEFTLVDHALYNFKTTLHDSTYFFEPGYLYFGTLPGQTEITYSKTLLITNIGNQQVSGLGFTITSNEPDVRELIYTNRPGDMDVDGSLAIPVTFSFTRPTSDKTVTFDITITDINNQVWTDHVSLPLSSRTPVEVTLRSGQGFIVTPGRNLVSFEDSHFDSTIRIPYIVDEQCEAMFTNSAITDEEAYCLSFGPINGSGCLSIVFDNFTQTGINEPDNDSASATTMTLNDVNVAYLQVGDIDYFNLAFDAVNKPFDGFSVGLADTPGFSYGVSVSGNYAYVADHNSGLQVIDINTPSAPLIVGSVDTPGDADGVSVSGDYAYVAAGYDLQVIDISTPSAPLIVGSVYTPGDAKGVSVSGDYAYVADDYSGLQVIDVSTPSAPLIVGSVNTPGYAEGVSVSGGYAYVADASGGLQVIDISTPSAPLIVSSVNTAGFSIDVSVSDGYAYVAASSSLQVIDVSTPSTPLIVGSVDIRDFTKGVSVSGGYAYITRGSGGLLVIDTSTPSAPLIVGSVDTPGLAIDVTVRGSYAYVADYNSGLQVINLTPSSGL